jgi:Amino acid synthesis
MTIRKTVTLVEEINSEYGASVRPPLRRVAIAAVFDNPLAGKAAGADLKPLIDYSVELGDSLTKAALATLGASPAQLRAYTKAALVGIGGDLEHGAAMIHPRLGMAMRRAIKRGRVIIPGHAKVGPPGTAVDLVYGPLDEGWDLDAFDSIPVLIHDAPRSQLTITSRRCPKRKRSSESAGRELARRHGYVCVNHALGKHWTMNNQGQFVVLQAHHNLVREAA